MNPLQMIYEALWTLALRSPELDDAVAPGNRIRFDAGGRDPIKPNLQTADTPELMLTTNGVYAANLHATSCSASLVRRYSWIITTGDFCIAECLFKIEWELFRTMSDSRAVLNDLQWMGKRFVKRTDVVDVANGQIEDEFNRGMRGWTAVWRMEIECHFPHADLKAGLNTP